MRKQKIVLVPLLLLVFSIKAASACDLTIEPPAPFGDVPRGTLATSDLILRSVGTASCQITSITLTGPDDFRFTGELLTPPFSLAAGQSVSQSIGFFPLEQSPRMGTVQIASDDPDTPVIVAPLTGVGIDPGCELIGSSPSVDLTKVPIGASLDASIVLESIGAIPCQVIAATFNNSDRFDLVDVQLPLTIAPDDGPVALAVRYTPDAVEFNSTSLRIESDDVTSSFINFSFFGSGVDRCNVLMASSINFGVVPPGEQRTRSFDITLDTNPAAVSECVVINVQTVDGPEFVVTESPTGQVLTGGQTASAEIVFSSVAQGLFEGNALVGVNAAVEPLTIVPMIARSAFDLDADGVMDDDDNCALAGNPAQVDTDQDGFGNRCDADFNNDCQINSADLGIFRTLFFQPNNQGDLNGDGITGTIDLGIFRTLFFGTPGPSALADCL